MRVKDFWHWLAENDMQVAENATIGELETLFREFYQNENKKEKTNGKRTTINAS